MEKLALCLSIVLLLSSSLASAQGPLELNVLFLGNSYTYYHDMPTLVENLAAAEGRILDHDEHLEGGWTWEMHWNSPLTIEKIHSRTWDVVVLQEFSTWLAQSDDTICSNTYPYLDNLVREIRLVSPDAVIQFYQTWGRPYGEQGECPSNPFVCDYFTMQDRLTESYNDVACMYKPSQIAPAGESFRRVRETVSETAFFELYETLGVSDHHPSLQGSYLVACNHFSTLFGIPCAGNTFTSTLDSELAATLQRIADETVAGGDWDFPQDDSCANCVCDCRV